MLADPAAKKNAVLPEVAMGGDISILDPPPAATMVYQSVDPPDPFLNVIRDVVAPVLAQDIFVI